MKRVTKSVTALLLALVLSLTLLPAQALAADTAPAQTTYIGSYVNPAYVGKIGIPRRQSTLSVQTAQITQPKKAGTVYTKEAAAAADLRKQMVSRSEEMSVTLRSSSKDVETIALNLWNIAMQASPSIQAISIPLRMSLTRRTATPSGSPPPRRRPR